MKTTTYQKVVNETGVLQFVDMADNVRTLEKDEYFALMVTESNAPYNSPHVKGIDAYTHEALVGIEKTSGEYGWYVSKDYSERSKSHRGNTVIVTVLPENLDKVCILKRHS